MPEDMKNIIERCKKLKPQIQSLLTDLTQNPNYIYSLPPMNEGYDYIERVDAQKWAELNQ